MIQEDTITIQGKDIIEKLGLEKMSSEQQAGLIEEISEVAYDSVLLRIAEKLTDKEAEELNDLLKEGDRERIEKFVKDKIPDVSLIFKEEIDKFTQRMIKKRSLEK